MKKTIFVLLFIVGIFGFIGCGSNGSSNPSGPAISGLTQSMSQVRGKLTGDGDLGDIAVELVAEGALITPAASLRAQTTANSSGGQIYFSQTAADGSFVFNNVIDGDYNLVAKGDSHSGIFNNIKVSAQANLAANEIILGLKATGDIKGQVSAPAGYSAPISGVGAFVPGTSYSAFTDTAGNFVISGVPVGAYTIVISGYGLVQKEVTNVVVNAAKTTDMTSVSLIIDPSGTHMAWKGTLTTAPANPGTNWAYYNSTDKKSYIYNGTSWDTIAESVAGTDGNNGTSIIWKGSAATAPDSQQLNWAYYNTTNGNAYVYDGSGWVLFVEARETEKPIITDIKASSWNQVTITWTTNEDSTSQVEYGPTIDYGSSTALDSKYTQSHSVTITGLAFGDYHFRVKSKDATGNEQVSDDTFTFASRTKQMGVKNAHISGESVTTDRFGNVYIGGYTEGNLSGEGLTGIRDFFISKYSIDGTKLWNKQMGVAGVRTKGYSVTTDNSGNVYIAGYTDGNLSGEGLTGAADFFISKYNSAGANLWTKQMGVAGIATTGNSVTTDSSGNVYVAGDTYGNLSGEGLTGDADFFISKYSSTGTHEWTKQKGVAGKETYGRSVTTDSSSNVYIGGYTSGNLAGEGSTGIFDFFISKYSSDGAFIWTKQKGIAGKATTGESVTTDSSGNVYVAGSTSGNLSGEGLTGNKDFFISKYSSEGALIWAKQKGVAGVYTNGESIAIDSSDNLYIAGLTGGDISGEGLTGTLDFVISKYNSSTGAHDWTKQMGVAGKETYGCGVTTDGSGKVYIAGYTQGGLDGNSLTGYTDFFITSYDENGN